MTAFWRIQIRLIYSSQRQSDSAWEVDHSSTVHADESLAVCGQLCWQCCLVLTSGSVAASACAATRVKHLQILTCQCCQISSNSSTEVTHHDRTRLALVSFASFQFFSWLPTVSLMYHRGRGSSEFGSDARERNDVMVSRNSLSIGQSHVPSITQFLFVLLWIEDLCFMSQSSSSQMSCSTPLDSLDFLYLASITCIYMLYPGTQLNTWKSFGKWWRLLPTVRTLTSVAHTMYRPCYRTESKLFCSRDWSCHLHTLVL